MADRPAFFNVLAHGYGAIPVIQRFGEEAAPISIAPIARIRITRHLQHHIPGYLVCKCAGRDRRYRRIAHYGNQLARVIEGVLTHVFDCRRQHKMICAVMAVTVWPLVNLAAIVAQCLGFDTLDAFGYHDFAQIGAARQHPLRHHLKRRRQFDGHHIVHTLEGAFADRGQSPGKHQGIGVIVVTTYGDRIAIEKSFVAYALQSIVKHKFYTV